MHRASLRSTAATQTHGMGSERDVLSLGRRTTKSLRESVPQGRARIHGTGPREKPRQEIPRKSWCPTKAEVPTRLPPTSDRISSQPDVFLVIPWKMGSEREHYGSCDLDVCTSAVWATSDNKNQVALDHRITAFPACYAAFCQRFRGCEALFEVAVCPARAHARGSPGRRSSLAPHGVLFRKGRRHMNGSTQMQNPGHGLIGSSDYRRTCRQTARNRVREHVRDRVPRTHQVPPYPVTRKLPSSFSPGAASWDQISSRPITPREVFFE